MICRNSEGLLFIPTVQQQTENHTDAEGYQQRRQGILANHFAGFTAHLLNRVGVQIVGGFLQTFGDFIRRLASRLKRLSKVC